MKKRVYTLYRVSTIGQGEKDDIPMQKEACHEFAERQGWEKAVFNKTSGETMNIMPKSSAYVTLRCQDE